MLVDFPFLGSERGTDPALSLAGEAEEIQYSLVVPRRQRRPELEDTAGAVFPERAIAVML